MKTFDKLARRFAGMALATLGLAAQAAWPDKPITLVVPYPPAGMTDVFARPIAQKLGERLGQTVIVLNKAGAGGTLGAAQVARAAPDGYTLVLGTFVSHAVNDALMKLSYHSLNDFTPVIPVAAVPSVLSVNAASPIMSLQELIVQARAKPGELTHASTGIGASPQLLIELLKQTAKVDINDINFNGGGPALLALLSGQVTMIFDTIGTSMPHIKAAKIRPLAISSAKRSPMLPDVPTVAEQGYPGFELVPWFAIWAPAGTPPAVVKRLNEELNAVLKMPDVQERFGSVGAEVMGGSVESFAAFHRAEYERWAKFIKSSGIKPAQ